MMIAVESLWLGAGITIGLSLLAHVIAEALLALLAEQPDEKEK